MNNNPLGGRPPVPKLGQAGGWTKSILTPKALRAARDATALFPVGCRVKSPSGNGVVLEIKKHGAVIVRVGLNRKSFSATVLERL